MSKFSRFFLSLTILACFFPVATGYADCRTEERALSSAEKYVRKYESRSEKYFNKQVRYLDKADRILYRRDVKVGRYNYKIAVYVQREFEAIQGCWFGSVRACRRAVSYGNRIYSYELKKDRVIERYNYKYLRYLDKADYYYAYYLNALADLSDAEYTRDEAWILLQQCFAGS